MTEWQPLRQSVSHLLDGWTGFLPGHDEGDEVGVATVVRARENRGLAYADGKIILQQADTNVVALDAKTGKELWKAVSALPDKQREAVMLRLEQDLSLEEIAAITGVGRETVKSRLRYALAKLRLELADVWP